MIARIITAHIQIRQLPVQGHPRPRQNTKIGAVDAPSSRIGVSDRFTGVVHGVGADLRAGQQNGRKIHLHP